MPALSYRSLKLDVLSPSPSVAGAKVAPLLHVPNIILDLSMEASLELPWRCRFPFNVVNEQIPILSYNFVRSRHFPLPHSFVYL